MKNSILPKGWMHYTVSPGKKNGVWIGNATKYVGIDRNTADDIYLEIHTTARSEKALLEKILKLIKSKKYKTIISEPYD